MYTLKGLVTYLLSEYLDNPEIKIYRYIVESLNSLGMAIEFLRFVDHDPDGKVYQGIRDRIELMVKHIEAYRNLPDNKKPSEADNLKLDILNLLYSIKTLNLKSSAL